MREKEDYNKYYLLEEELGRGGFGTIYKALNKYEVKRINIPAIIQKIKYILENYSICYNDFEEYRRTIVNEKEDCGFPDGSSDARASVACLRGADGIPQRLYAG